MLNVVFKLFIFTSPDALTLS